MGWAPCEECGYEFLYVNPMYYQACSKCTEDLHRSCSGLFEDATLYRAIRPDENPSEGIQRSDPTATVPVGEHVLRGSYMPTQYISLSYSVEVALYFAVRGAMSRGDRPARVIEVECAEDPMEQALWDQDNLCPYFDDDRRARNYARAFRETLFERDIPSCLITKVYTIPDNILDFFENEDFTSFRKFSQILARTNLLHRYQAAPPADFRVSITAPLAGFQFFDGVTMRDVRSRRTTLNQLYFINDPENAHEYNIRVETRDGSGNRKTIGYIQRYHRSRSRNVDPFTDEFTSTNTTPFTYQVIVDNAEFGSIGGSRLASIFFSGTTSRADAMEIKHLMSDIGGIANYACLT